MLKETKCPLCGYIVEDRDAVRCPRCFKPLITIPACCGGNCSSCGAAPEKSPGSCEGSRKPH